MFALIQSFIALVTGFFTKRAEDKRLEKLEKSKVFDNAIDKAKHTKDSSDLDNLF